MAEDDDDFAQELLDLGADESQIEDARARAETFEEASPAFAPDDVWEENRQALRVFSECRWMSSVLSGMAGAVRIFEGISSQEIACTCDLLGVPPASRSDVLLGVRIMERVALPLMNRKHA